MSMHFIWQMYIFSIHISAEKFEIFSLFVFVKGIYLHSAKQEH